MLLSWIQNSEHPVITKELFFCSSRGKTVGEGVKCTLGQHCWRFLYGWWGSVWCSVPLEEVQQGYCDVISPLLPEFFTSSTDFYLPEDKLHGKRQLKKSAEATVPVEWDFEGSFPFPSACSQIAVHRDSPCARTAVHLALVSRACVDGANYKEKFIWERLGDTQNHVNKQWDWSSKTWLVPSCCLCPGRCQASLWVSAFQLCREQNRSFLLFVWVIALVCSALYNAVILCASFLEHQLWESYLWGNLGYRKLLTAQESLHTVASLWCCWQGRPSAKNDYFQA